MKIQNELKLTYSTFRIPILFILLIWSIYWIEIQFSLNFNRYGIYPRTLKGFRGVFLMHFIHGDAKHIFNNTIPVFVLLSGLFYFYREVAFKVLLFGGLILGVFTWMIARESYHIGASGIVYLLFSFVFFSGMIKKHYRLMAFSLVVIFLYGSMIWYVLPIKEGMSWEGHLSGFLVGLLFAILYRKKGLKKEAYIFAKTDFDDLFDENGNLITNENSEKETSDLSENNTLNSTD